MTDGTTSREEEMNKRRRHCPLFSDQDDADYNCVLCGADPIDPIHWPPVGFREHILDLFGLLR